MPSTRKLVRTAIRDVLGAPNGFNATLAAIAAGYGIDPFAVDFGAGSKNLFFGRILPGQVELSGIAEYPAMLIYTSEMRNEHTNKPLTFSGPVLAHVDVYLQFRDGAEQGDTETVCEAVEDAVLTCLERDSAPWPPGLHYTGEYSSDPGPIAMIGEGWERVIPMQFLFRVDA